MDRTPRPSNQPTPLQSPSLSQMTITQQPNTLNVSNVFSPTSSNNSPLPSIPDHEEIHFRHPNTRSKSLVEPVESITRLASVTPQMIDKLTTNHPHISSVQPASSSSSSNIGRRMTVGPSTPSTTSKPSLGTYPQTLNVPIPSSSTSSNQSGPTPTSPKANWIKSLGQQYKSPSLKSSTNSMPRNAESTTDLSSEIWVSTNLDDYQIDTVIGIGSSATVYAAHYKLGNRKVALKVIDLDNFERNQIEELRKETQVMSLCKHPNVLPVQAAFVTESKLYIVTPFLSAGSVLDIMKYSFKEGLDEVSVSTILKQILNGLEYLHKNSHIHRDVKAGNVLIDSDGTAVLADLGVTASLEAADRKAKRKTFVGTPCWMAPEVMEHAAYDFHADIWSFGITVLEMATGRAPLAKYPPVKILMLTLNNNPPILDLDTTKYKYSKSARDLAALCLQKDPSLRPTAEKLLTHAFFSKAKKPSYLVGTLLSNLPPLSERSRSRNLHHYVHGKVALAGNSQTPVSWDFSVDSPQTEQDALPESKLGHAQSTSSLFSNKPQSAPTNDPSSYGHLNGGIVGLGIDVQQDAANTKGNDIYTSTFEVTSNTSQPDHSSNPGSPVPAGHQSSVSSLFGKHSVSAPTITHQPSSPLPYNSTLAGGGDIDHATGSSGAYGQIPTNNNAGEAQPGSKPHRRGRFEVSVASSANLIDPSNQQVGGSQGMSTNIQCLTPIIGGSIEGTPVNPTHPASVHSLTRQQSITLPGGPPISSANSTLRRESSLSSTSNASSNGTPAPYMSALANVAAAAAIHHANSVSSLHNTAGGGNASNPAGVGGGGAVSLNNREVDALLRRHEMTFTLLSSVADRIGVRTTRSGVIQQLPPATSQTPGGTTAPNSIANLTNTSSNTPTTSRGMMQPPPTLPLVSTSNTSLKPILDVSPTGNASNISILESVGSVHNGIIGLIRENEQLRAENDRLRKELLQLQGKGTG